MGRKVKAIEIIEIPDDDDHHVPVSIPSDPTEQPANGANKEKAILVESYCQSMETRNSKKRMCIDLNRVTQETQYEEVQVLDSFVFQNRNPRRRITINSNFEHGESSNTQQSGSLFVCEDCRLILPHEVFDRWGKALCEAVILESQKFYCPYKDCSAMLINDGGMALALSNCQYCERNFCAHFWMDFREFQSLNKDEREAEDFMLMQLAKSAGCSIIVCRCGYVFCYTCGTSYARPGCRFMQEALGWRRS